MPPQPGDTLRVEVSGYALRGYLNGTKVLEATDADASKIADGVPGLAARWATGNMGTTTTAKVWESWAVAGFESASARRYDADELPDPDSDHESGGDAGTPRWVKAFGIVAVALILAFAILHLTGHGFRGH